MKKLQITFLILFLSGCAGGIGIISSPKNGDRFNSSVWANKNDPNLPGNVYVPKSSGPNYFYMGLYEGKELYKRNPGKPDIFAKVDFKGGILVSNTQVVGVLNEDEMNAILKGTKLEKPPKSFFAVDKALNEALAHEQKGYLTREQAQRVTNMAERNAKEAERNAIARAKYEKKQAERNAKQAERNAIARAKYEKKQAAELIVQKARKQKHKKEQEQCLSNGQVGVCTKSGDLIDRYSQSRASYELGYFATVDLTVRNNTSQNIKDLTFICDSIGRSGSIIGDRRFKIYENFPVKKEVFVSHEIRKFKQTDTIKCRVRL